MSEKARAGTGRRQLPSSVNVDVLAGLAREIGESHLQGWQAGATSDSGSHVYFRDIFAVAAIAARGSRIVFDYFTERALRDLQSVLAPVAKNVAAVGDPFVFGMPGDNAAAFIGARGFSVVSDFGSAELAQEYLPKAFAMPSPSANRVCVAEIK